jgi:DNA-binding XRE family transcriptional regulator
MKCVAKLRKDKFGNLLFFFGGQCKELNEFLMDEIELSIKDLKGNEIFNNKGVLKIINKNYYIGDKDLSKSLHSLIGTEIKVQVELHKSRELYYKDDLKVNDKASVDNEEIEDLKAIREEHEITVADMAKRLGVCPASLCNYETLKVLPSSDFMEKYRVEIVRLESQGIAL